METPDALATQARRLGFYLIGQRRKLRVMRNARYFI